MGRKKAPSPAPAGVVTNITYFKSSRGIKIFLLKYTTNNQI